MIPLTQFHSETSVNKQSSVIYNVLGIDRKIPLKHLTNNQQFDLLKNWPDSPLTGTYESLQVVVARFKGDSGFPMKGFINLDESTIVNGTKLYIRKCYSELYKIIKQGGRDRIAITGTPGIGFQFISSSACYTTLPLMTPILWYSTPSQRCVIVIMETN